jgi:D-alanyl-D-alanine carboxypeptidase
MLASLASAAYRRRVAAALRGLGVGAEQIAARKLKLFAEASRLAPVGLGTDGRDKMLTPAAAKAWLAMRARAKSDGVELLLVSAFRSLDFQAALIRGKLQRGHFLEDVLKINAPPGYSEHHSGRAIDVGTQGIEPLEESFDRTEAFAWLSKNAQRFGFSMSYPKDNPQGFLYEPWHWCYHP